MKMQLLDYYDHVCDELFLDIYAEKEDELDTTQYIELNTVRKKLTFNHVQDITLKRVCKNVDSFQGYLCPIWGCSYEDKRIYVFDVKSIEYDWDAYGEAKALITYICVSKIKFKNNLDNQITKMNVIGIKKFNHDWFFQNMKGIEKKGYEIPMYHYELTNREHKFKIYPTNLAGIRKEDVDKISEAWAINYYIFLSVYGEGENLYFEVFSSRVVCQNALDIRSNWSKYAMLLKAEPKKIPMDWINYIKNNLGGF